MRKPDPKRFTFDKPTGEPSEPLGVGKVMAAASRSIKVGQGAFRVTRSGTFHHPGLNRTDALSLTKEILKTIPIGGGVVVRNAAGNKVFHAERVATNPYRNPFRDVAMSPARIDAGVDYCGSGWVHPLGNAVITNVGTPSHTSTFGDDMAVYQLLDGPAKGKFVFFAEHYNNAPGLHNGMHVDTDTKLYLMDGCIEIGWSDGNGSMAWGINSNIEGQLTAWGDNFNDLLVSLDCISGLPLGRPTTMTLPRDWPTAW